MADSTISTIAAAPVAVAVPAAPVKPSVIAVVEADIAAAKAKAVAEVVTVKSGFLVLVKAYWLPAASLLVGFVAGKLL